MHPDLALVTAVLSETLVPCVPGHVLLTCCVQLEAVPSSCHAGLAALTLLFLLLTLWMGMDPACAQPSCSVQALSSHHSCTWGCKLPFLQSGVILPR